MSDNKSTNNNFSTTTTTTTTTTTPGNTNNEENNNNNDNNNNNNNAYTPREKLLHLLSLLPNKLQDKEHLVNNLHKLGERFSSVLGLDNKNNNNNTKEKDKDKERIKEAKDIDEDEFVLVRSNEEITNEIKDEEFAKALQQEEIEELEHERRMEAARQNEQRRQANMLRMQAERQRRREQETREMNELRQLIGPRNPDLFTMLLFGLEGPPLLRQPSSSAPMYIISNQANEGPAPPAGVVDKDNLPSYVFNGRPLPVEKNSCTICLNEFKQGDTLKTLPCLHIFHSMCIDEWIEVSRTCPICKNSIE